MWPEWSRSVSSGADRYGSDEEEGSGDTQRRKRRTGERSVFDRFIGEFNYSETSIALTVLMRLCLPWLSNSKVLFGLFHCEARYKEDWFCRIPPEYQGYCWHDVRPGCCDDVSLGPGLRPPWSARISWLTITRVPPSALALTLRTPGHSEPVRQCQSSPDWIRVVNFIIDPSTDKILRRTEYKLSVKLESVKHYRDICRLLGRIQNISFSINQF